MLKKLIIFTICFLAASNCESIIEGRPSGNVDCRGELQWRQFHGLVFGRPCRGIWDNRKGLVAGKHMMAGHFDDDYVCYNIYNDNSPTAFTLPTEKGKYGEFDILYETKKCNLAWERMVQGQFPRNAIAAGSHYNQSGYIGRTHIDTASYRIGKVRKNGDVDVHGVMYCYKNGTCPTNTQEFDVLVCRD